jgi:hypothetical protein
MWGGLVGREGCMWGGFVGKGGNVCVCVWGGGEAESARSTPEGTASSVVHAWLAHACNSRPQTCRARR